MCRTSDDRHREEKVVFCFHVTSAYLTTFARNKQCSSLVKLTASSKNHLLHHRKEQLCAYESDKSYIIEDIWKTFSQISCGGGIKGCRENIEQPVTSWACGPNPQMFAPPQFSNLPFSPPTSFIRGRNETKGKTVSINLQRLRSCKSWARWCLIGSQESSLGVSGDRAPTSPHTRKSENHTQSLPVSQEK